MKAFSLSATLVLVVIALSSPIANAATNTTMHANGTAHANATNNANTTEKPIFLPGVGTPPGLESGDGSAGKGSPLVGVHGADTGSTEGAIAKPTPAGNKNATTPMPSKSAASTALVGAGVVAVSTTVLSLALF